MPLINVKLIAGVPDHSASHKLTDRRRGARPAARISAPTDARNRRPQLSARDRRLHFGADAGRPLSP